MPRWQGTTADRGLGTEHQRARKAALAALRDGDPCARCEQRGVYHPMYRAAARLLDLDDFPGRMFGGPQVKRLSYRACNRSHGAALGNRMRGFTLRAATPAGSHVVCKTCGQRYTRAARICAICGSHYHPSRQIQYTCSRKCGTEYQRRNRLANGWQPPEICACGKIKRASSARCADCTAAYTAELRLLRLVQQPGRHTKVYYYTCRYCGKLSVAKMTAERRQVCTSRPCQAQRLNDNRERNDGRSRPIAVGWAGDAVAQARAQVLDGLWRGFSGIALPP